MQNNHKAFLINFLSLSHVSVTEEDELPRNRNLPSVQSQKHVVIIKKGKGVKMCLKLEEMQEDCDPRGGNWGREMKKRSLSGNREGWQV